MNEEQYQLWAGYAVALVAPAGIRRWWDEEDGRLAFHSEVRDMIDERPRHGYDGSVWQSRHDTRHVISVNEMTRRQDDYRPTSTRVRRTDRKRGLTSGTSPDPSADGLGCDLAREVNHDRVVDGDHVVVLHYDSQVVYVTKLVQLE